MTLWHSLGRSTLWQPSDKYNKVIPCGVMVNVMDCKIIVSEFKLHLHYYVHFWTNTLGKHINLIIPPQLWIK